MTSFEAFASALQARDTLQALIRQTVSEATPGYRYAQVTTIDRVARTATVQFPEGGDPALVQLGAVEPGVTGQIVRVNGVPGDRYIEDVVGPVMVAFKPTALLPTAIVPNQSALSGVSQEVAPIDHRHAVGALVTQTDVNNTPLGGVLAGTIANAGFAADMATEAELNSAISTHASTTHGFTPVYGVPIAAGQAVNAAGSADTLSRSDHGHAFLVDMATQAELNTHAGTPHGSSLTNMRSAAFTNQLSGGVTGDTYNRWMIDSNGDMFIDGALGGSYDLHETGYRGLHIGANTFVGFSAGTDGSGYNTGSQNTGFGSSTCRGQGSNNTGVGHTALSGISTGSNNTGVGRAAAAGISTGINNTAVGNLTLNEYTGGVTVQSDNTAIGNTALQKQTASNGTAVGSYSLPDATTGEFNTALGYGAGYHNGADINGPFGVSTITGSRQTLIGAKASQGPYSPQVNDVTALGFNTKVSANDTVAIGSGAIAEQQGSVALGAASHTTQVNQVMIGPRDIEITDAFKGVVLKSPDGNRWRLLIANGGTVSIVAA